MNDIIKLTKELENIKADVKVEEKMLEKIKDDLFQLCNTKSTYEAKKINEKINISIEKLNSKEQNLIKTAYKIINEINHEL